jgi:phosphoribosylformylglycinamidine synthase subunit PurQ / glutaminase
MGKSEVKACIITGFGINADYELHQAFRMAGAEATLIHITDIIEKSKLLEDFHILAFPGGFSYGDHLGSGKVFATLFKKHLKSALEEFIAAGKLVIGICNGFQVLVKMGILPNLEGGWKQEVSLIHNDSGKFEDRWVLLKTNPASPCVWTQGLDELEFPVRHGEGKFVILSPTLRRRIESDNLMVIRYASASGGEPGYPANPNGSIMDIAGICDPSGRVFGLMPHPEAFLIPENHPRWTCEKILDSDGLLLFENGVEYIKNTIV